MQEFVSDDLLFFGPFFGIAIHNIILHIKKTKEKSMNQKYEKFIRLSEVIKRTGISRSSIYRLVNKNKFPAPVRISEKTIAFIESEINDWIENLINSSRNKAA